MRNERQEIDNKGLDQIITAKQKQAEKINQSEDLSLEIRRGIGKDIAEIIKKYRGC